MPQPHRSRLRHLRLVPLSLLFLVGVVSGWWLTGSDHSTVELAAALQWVGIGGMLVGGMIVAGSTVDAHNDGGIIDLNEDAVGARMERAGRGMAVVVGLVVSGAIVVGAGLWVGGGWVI